MRPSPADPGRDRCADWVSDLDRANPVPTRSFIGGHAKGRGWREQGTKSWKKQKKESLKVG